MDTTAASRGLATTAAAAYAPLDAGCPVSAEYSAAYAGSGGQVWSTAQRGPGHPSEQTHAGAAFAPNLRCGQAGGMAPDQRWGGTSGAVTFPAATATMSAPSGLMYSDPWAAVAAPGVSAPSQAGGPPSWLLQGRGDPPPAAMATPSTAAVPHQQWHPGAPLHPRVVPPCTLVVAARVGPVVACPLRQRVPVLGREERLEMVVLAAVGAQALTALAPLQWVTATTRCQPHRHPWVAQLRGHHLPPACRLGIGPGQHGRFASSKWARAVQPVASAASGASWAGW